MPGRLSPSNLSELISCGSTSLLRTRRSLPRPRQHQDDKASGTGYRWGKACSDDEYNVNPSQIRRQHKCRGPAIGLAHPGAYGQLCDKCDRAALELQINLGRPFAIHNDPNGEADLVAGSYTANSNSNGAGQHYSWKN